MKIDQKKLSDHLSTAMVAIMTVLISSVLGFTVGCYINLSKDLNTIKTVLILKGIMPEGLAHAQVENER